MHSQLVVLGGGPGGYAAAFLAADHGMQVTRVEQEGRLGDIARGDRQPRHAARSQWGRR